MFDFCHRACLSGLEVFYKSRIPSFLSSIFLPTITELGSIQRYFSYTTARWWKVLRMNLVKYSSSNSPTNVQQVCKQQAFDLSIFSYKIQSLPWQWWCMNIVRNKMSALENASTLTCYGSSGYFICWGRSGLGEAFYATDFHHGITDFKRQKSTRSVTNTLFLLVSRQFHFKQCTSSLKLISSRTAIFPSYLIYYPLLVSIHVVPEIRAFA